MDVIDRTLHKILYTKHSKSGGKIKQKEYDYGDVAEENAELWYNVYKYDNINKKGMPVRRGGKKAQYYMHGGSQTPQYYCSMCNKAHTTHSLKGKEHLKYRRV